MRRGLLVNLVEGWLRWVAVVDQVLATLQVGIAGEQVFIQRGRLQDLAGTEQAGARIHNIEQN